MSDSPRASRALFIASLLPGIGGMSHLELAVRQIAAFLLADPSNEAGVVVTGDTADVPKWGLQSGHRDAIEQAFRAAAGGQLKGRLSLVFGKSQLRHRGLTLLS